MNIPPPIDTGRLASFIRTLNVARQFIAAYPPDHPLLRSAEERASREGVEVLGEIGSFTLGVSKDSLFLADLELDRSITPFSVLARSLYDRGVATITFLNGMTTADLHTLNLLLSHKPDSLRQRGGIASLLAEATDRIRIVEIDYRAFVAIEGMGDGDRSHRLWDLFMRTLLSGADQIDATGESGIDFDDVERLSALVTELGSTSSVRRLIDHYGQSLVTFSRHISQKGLISLLERIGTLVEKLPDDLKRQFVSRSVESLSGTPEALMEMLKKIDPAFLDTMLQEMAERNGPLPSLVLSLITRFETERGGALPPAFGMEQEHSEKIRDLFREDDLDRFLPRSYQESLEVILRKDIPLQPSLTEELSAEMETLSPHALEQKTGAIIMELIRQGSDDELLPMLVRNFAETVRYHVDTGDYTHALSLLESIDRNGVDSPVSPLIRDKIREHVTSLDFVSEILGGLTLWGKAKYEEIRRFILWGGTPFVSPLLDRLASEENMSLRRYYIDRLMELKPPLQTLLDRLNDDRWYVVRNILVLLRAIGNSSCCRQLSRLTRHPHPRVRQEAIRTLAHFGDREADRIILGLLGSSDEETVMGGLHLAEKSRSTELFRAVLSLLDRGGLTNYEYRIKSAAVQTLGEMGNPEALPRLEKILFSSTLIHAAHHNRLKGDIIRTLPLYPVQSVVHLFKKIAENGSKEMIALAEESYRIIQRKRQGG